MFSNKVNIIGLMATAITSGAFAMNRVPFVWKDINTREVVRWEGDTAIVKQGNSMQELACKINIKPNDVAYSISSFGIPKSWTSFTFTDEKDLAEKQLLLKTKAASHGIKMMDEGNRFIVDYNWVINQNKSAIVDIAKQIRSTARRNGYRSRRELVGAFSSFVQSLEYRIPPEYRINIEGEKILTAGAMMPLETLSNRWGDCDSKSMLFAALVKSIGLVDVCFIVMEEHLFAAVLLKPNQEDKTIRHKGKDWVLIELTDAWPIGRVPQDRSNGVIFGKYRIVDLDN
jgi:hypothetical protein